MYTMKHTLLFFCLYMSSVALKAQLYFPPLTGNAWESVTPASLGWCQQYLDSLDELLLNTNSKAFIILKDGKIAHERYFGTFTQDSAWYWASAGKSLTGFLVGIAQQEGFLSIDDTSSKYLGQGWTNCTAAQEAEITVRHQLTMTSGLDDGVANKDCTLDSCLIYKADAGTRWAYHNAPYTLLDGVIEGATGQNLNAFHTTRVKLKTGMTGLYVQVDYNNVYVSTARSMARFGLLMLNKGKWNNTVVLSDTTYYNQMINTSQNLNLSYGYLWWLNGKGQYMVPGLQLQLNGNIIPNAPNDMFAALGKNDQKVHVVPSQNLVLIRMGDAAYANELVPLTLDDDIWYWMNRLLCTNVGIKQDEQELPLAIYPNPAVNELQVNLPMGNYTLEVYNMNGQLVYQTITTGSTRLNTGTLNAGTFILKATDTISGKASRLRFSKVE